jgi:antitoxin PrlF
LSKSGSARPTRTIHDFIGCLAGKTKKIAMLDEINEAIERGWAGQVKVGRK